MSQTDFNDLHKVRGIEAVREQILQAIEAGPEPASNDPDGETPPAPSDSGGVGERLDIDQALKQFALIHGETKIYDYRLRKVFKASGIKATVGNEVFKAWLEHPDRRTVTWADVNGYQAKPDGSDPLNVMLDRYVLIYPTTDIWDRKIQQLVTKQALQAYLPNEFNRWLEHPKRATINREHLVFDPTQKADPATTINTFTGIPLEPDGAAPGTSYVACRGICKLLWHLCNRDEAVYDWVLKWLAYPLQHVGAKLDTALLFHSDIQGSGKSLFFGRVMTTIYGQYAAILGQHQLESQYTDWRSRLLYAVFEEVLSRTEKHNQMGTIKHMITGATQRIEQKFVSGWEEANHMNGVFLSNEIQPFPLEPSDRRFLVVWPKKTLDEPLQALVSRELDQGGPEAFYQYLLDYPLGDFNPHSKPLETDARQRIIEFSLPNFEVFFNEWKSGELDVPFSPCLTRDLYHVYQNWCRKTGNRPLSETKLITIYASRIFKVRKFYRLGAAPQKLGTFFIPDGCQAPEKVYEMDWLGDCVGEFRLRWENNEES